MPEINLLWITAGKSIAVFKLARYFWQPGSKAGVGGDVVALIDAQSAKVSGKTLVG